MKLLRNSAGNYIIVSNDYSQRNLNTPNNSLNEVIDMYKTQGLFKDKKLKTKLLKQKNIKELASFENIEDLYDLIPEEFI